MFAQTSWLTWHHANFVWVMYSCCAQTFTMCNIFRKCKNVLLLLISAFIFPFIKNGKICTAESNSQRREKEEMDAGRLPVQNQVLWILVRLIIMHNIWFLIDIYYLISSTIFVWSTFIQVNLTSEEDHDWQKLKYLQLPQVIEHFEKELKKDLR